MPKAALAGLLGAAVLAVLGVAGWGGWRLYQDQQRTDAKLRETLQSLTDSRKTLQLIEEERGKLSEAYDVLKTRWSDSDQELARLKSASSKMTLELGTLTAERTELQGRLGTAATDTQGLQDAVTKLQQEYAAVEAQRTELEADLNEAARSLLTPAEVEQLGLALARHQDEEERLRQEVEALTHAYEQTTQEWALLEQQMAGQPSRDGKEAAAVKGASRRDRMRSAARLRALGEMYLATHQYAQAAQAFEESLTYQDHPGVHSRLVFIYGRMLHDPEKARIHTALAPAKGDPTTSTMMATPNAYALPRKQSRLLWNWLANK